MRSSEDATAAFPREGVPRQRIEPVDGRTFTSMLEQLQEAYVTAVAATAGCAIEEVKRDNWGFDAWLVRPPVRIGDRQEISIAVQLKNTTTIKPDPAKEYFSFQFKERRSFDALSYPRVGVKAFLLVMTSPPIQAAWTQAEHEGLNVAHCCYWADLRGYQVDPEIKSPTVRIPTANIFDAATLAGMMDQMAKELAS